MAFKMKIDNDEIDLSVLVKNAVLAGDNMLKKCGNIIKARAIGNLNAIKNSRDKRPREIHMANDVTVKIAKDKYGYKLVKIGGGKQTGTLWHIVNDGTYRSKATHFMDKLIQESEAEVQQIIDEELRKVFG